MFLNCHVVSYLSCHCYVFRRQPGWKLLLSNHSLSCSPLKTCLKNSPILFVCFSGTTIDFVCNIRTFRNYHKVTLPVQELGWRFRYLSWKINVNFMALIKWFSIEFSVIIPFHRSSILLQWYGPFLAFLADSEPICFVGFFFSMISSHKQYQGV